MHNTPKNQGVPQRPAAPAAPQSRPPFQPRPYQGNGGGGGYQGNRPWQRREERPLEKGQHRINHQIRVPEIRVVQDGNQLGIMRTSEALILAQEAGLDLVEIAANGHPPVCSIMDYGRFKYEEKIKKKEADRKQRESSTQLKEIHISPSIGDNDLMVKIKQANEFIAEGKRVQIVVKFSRRQLNHKEFGFEQINKFVAALGDKIIIESPAKLDGNRLNCRVAPK